jgi:hypothetical protein
MHTIFEGSKKTRYLSMITSGLALGIRFTVFLLARVSSKGLAGSNPAAEPEFTELPTSIWVIL